MNRTKHLWLAMAACLPPFLVQACGWLTISIALVVPAYETLARRPFDKQNTWSALKYGMLEKGIQLSIPVLALGAFFLLCGSAIRYHRDEAAKLRKLQD